VRQMLEQSPFDGRMEQRGNPCCSAQQTDAKEGFFLCRRIQERKNGGEEEKMEGGRRKRKAKRGELIESMVE
jgi:hypothetical protein